MKVLKKYYIDQNQYNIIEFSNVLHSFVISANMNLVAVRSRQRKRKIPGDHESGYLWKTVWTGMGIFWRRRYFGIFQYAENKEGPFDHLSRIVGFHIGTIHKGDIHIFGINVSGIYAAFNCTWHRPPESPKEEKQAAIKKKLSDYEGVHEDPESKRETLNINIEFSEMMKNLNK